jgi:GR25 family glycosyltransferase involved in LPS biosynthesis
MIIDKNNLELWMISLIGNHHADALRTVTIPKWQNEGFTVNLFNAIIPDNILNISNQLNFTLKKTLLTGIKEFTETEKAVWYSHLQLWNRCVITNKPLLILEEDCRPIKRFPDTFEVVKLRCVAEAAAAYIILPSVAKNMIKNAFCRELSYNVDSYIKAYSDKDIKLYAKQVEREMRSISHN